MKAYGLRRVDKDRDMHWQAWLNQQVKATKGKGRSQKPYYRNFNDFFDHEEKEKMILNPEPSIEDEKEKERRKKVIDLAAMANS